MPSAARRALSWWFDTPFNAHVSASIAIDFTEALRYLAQLNAQGHRVSVHHLMVASIARILREFPMANGRILGGKMVFKKEVGVAMPINLLGHEGGKRSELSLSIMKAVDQRPLRELAQAQRKEVADERQGKPGNAFVASLFRWAEAAPEPLLFGLLNTLDALGKRPAFAEVSWNMGPFTTAITNPGAALGNMPGVWFRGAAVSLPHRLVHVGTLWGLGGIQEEVVPFQGQPAVRSVLPLVLVFDHRLFDGVMCGKILARLTEILQQPAGIFGPSGEYAADKGIL